MSGARQRPAPGVGAGLSGLRFHDRRHTAATLAAASGTSLKALMARIGHNSPAAALRYQHVLDGQDARIVSYLEQVGKAPATPRDGRRRAASDQSKRAHSGHDGHPAASGGGRNRRSSSGADGNRTHDPLLAKQVL